MSDYKRLIEVKVGSERSFGIILAILFFLIGIYPIMGLGEIRLWSLILAVILILVAFLKPVMLSVPNKIWFKFGIELGAILSPIVMTFIYLIAVVPIGITMNLMGKDILRLKLDKKSKSYWIKRNQPVGTMRKQF